jgi:hypothetical protein
MTKLSSEFGLTNLDLRDILLRTLTALDQTLDDEIQGPTDDEFEGIVSSLSAKVKIFLKTCYNEIRTDFINLFTPK